MQVRAEPVHQYSLNTAVRNRLMANFGFDYSVGWLQDGFQLNRDPGMDSGSTPEIICNFSTTESTFPFSQN